MADDSPAKGSPAMSFSAHDALVVVRDQWLPVVLALLVSYDTWHRDNPAGSLASFVPVAFGVLAQVSGRYFSDTRIATQHG